MGCGKIVLMGEHLKLGIAEGVEKLTEKVRGERKTFKTDGIELKEKKQGVMAWALRSLATRIVLTRSVEDLSTQLTTIADSLNAGKDPAEVDALRSVVSLKIGELLSGESHTQVIGLVDHFLESGDVKGAVKLLRELKKKDEYKVANPKNKEMDDLLHAVEVLDNERGLNEKKLNPLITAVEATGDKVSVGVNRELVEVRKKNDLVETTIQIKNLAGSAPASSPDRYVGRIQKTKKEVKTLDDQVKTALNKKDIDTHNDRKFITRMLTGGSNGYGAIDSSGNLTVEVDKFTYQDTKLAYARTSVVLGRNKSILSQSQNKELRDYLEQVQAELRGRLKEIETELNEKKIAENMTPKDDLWSELSDGERAKITNNFDFMRKYSSAEDLAKYAQENGMSKSRSEQLISMLMKQRPELAGKFEINERGVFWNGKAEDFFELCRQEIYRIKDSVPEERLGQLEFVQEAQLYLALMGVSAKNNPEIRQMKDAVTKMLYMEFAIKSLWKAGGNHEAWQRAAGLLLRDEAGSNFFTTMKVRERIRGVLKGDNSKKVVLLPGFNVDDIMTIGELEAPNGQSWLAYVSTDNMALNERRLEEFARALALQVAKKAQLKNELTSADTKNLKLLEAGNIELDREQMDWMRNYLQYMHVATLNVGEKLWVMNAVKPGDKGFDYASLPGGQFAEKTGIWGLLYFAKYQVTKYGFEGLGKIFVPNHGVLSYARGETLRHFLSYDGNETWLEDGDGGITNGGTGGAKDFFFKRKNVDNKTKAAFLKFWEETWLDGRTGTNMKTKGMRSIFNARKIGRDLISKGMHKEFIDEMDFTQLESLIGYRIPGRTNEDKLLWTVDNLSYEMMEVRTMPSKREGDLINKYSKYYTETDTALQTFLDAPTLANKMKLIESIVRYNNASAEDISRMLDEFMASNRKMTGGLKEGGRWWNLFDYNIGPTVADSNQKNLKKSVDGDWMEMPLVTKSPSDGWYPGRKLLWTRQQYKEGTQDPMIMRKIEIQNAIAWGIVSPQEGGKMMRDWQKMIYFGEGVTFKVKGKNIVLRPGMIPFLTPFFLMRGWWVDKMGLDWEDFKTISRKVNEETWEKIRKALGV